MISRRRYLGGLIAAASLMKARASSALGLDRGDAPQDPHAGHAMPKPSPLPRGTEPKAVPGQAAEPKSARYTKVVTPNGSTLPFTMKEGVKEFRLTAEPLIREFAPGMNVNCWGYNGSTPGPTI